MSQPVPVRRELGRTLALAIPVVVGELGWMAMGIVDSVMVGRLGPAALGAVSVGRTLVMITLVAGVGLLLSLDTVVSQSWGARRFDDCRRWLVDGTWLALLLAVPLTLVVLLLAGALDRLEMAGEVRELARPYVAVRAFSVAPLVVSVAFRRYLQAIGAVRPVMIALLSANVINALGNWLLIWGHWGLPRMGVVGSAWATVLASAYLLLALVFAAWRRSGERADASRVRLALDLGRLRLLLALGVPAALYMLLDVGVFALSTLLAARLAPVALAAHHVALTVASTIFMLPLGVHSAAAVRVGHAVGRGDGPGAWRAGWMAIAVGVGLTACACLPLLAVPSAIVRLFSDDGDVLRLGVVLLALAAAFLVFDALQIVTTGALRGMGDTRSPAAAQLCGHWLLGLPVGYTLCFHAGLGAVGLWLGWLVGLTLVASVMLLVWRRRGRRIAAGLAA